jgi:hypothetical protein
MTSAADVWGSFSHDPRVSANAVLRATDRDRDVVHQVLAEAYADGRLDRDEFDTRSAQTAAARTLGELPPLLADLVEPVPVPPGGVLPAGGAELRQQAVAKYKSDRRDAFWGFLAPSFICVVIWLAFGPGFFWPGFVIAGTGINVLSMLIRRENIIEEKIRRLEKKRAKEHARELEARRSQEKPGGMSQREDRPQDKPEDQPEDQPESQPDDRGHETDGHPDDRKDEDE